MDQIQGELSLEQKIQEYQLNKARQVSEQYKVWREKAGARHVLKHFFAMTAGYVGQWKKTGIPVSNALIFELVRHKLKHRVSRAAERREIQLSKWDGYTLNNNFRAHIAREVMSKRLEWYGIFEIRELKEQK